jgi:hypothetical protein
MAAAPAYIRRGNIGKYHRGVYHHNKRMAASGHRSDVIMASGARGGACNENILAAGVSIK